MGMVSLVLPVFGHKIKELDEYYNSDPVTERDKQSLSGWLFLKHDVLIHQVTVESFHCISEQFDLHSNPPNSCWDGGNVAADGLPVDIWVFSGLPVPHLNLYSLLIQTCS